MAILTTEGGPAALADKRVDALLARFTDACLTYFADGLAGVYLHGSLALGDFRWEQGDVDLLVLVKEPPGAERKTAFARAVLALDGDAPPKGLETSVVLARCMVPLQYPTPFEWHFSHMHKARCQSDPRAYSLEMHGVDRDLASYAGVIRARGHRLWGADIADAFAPVPPAYYLDSLLTDLRESVEGLPDNAAYCVLNLCRTRAYLCEGLVLSKADGARWAIPRLADAGAAFARMALDAYTGASPFPPDADAAALKAFARGMLADVEEAAGASAQR